MAGYGMRDGSAIIRAIGDYANYKQRQEQIEYQRDQQDYENRLAERRMAMDEHRQNTRLNMQIDEANYRTSERERIASERQRSQDARQGYVDYTSDAIDEQERQALDHLKTVERSTASGDPIEVVDAGDGEHVSFGVMKADGRRVPLTSVGSDDKSTPLRAKKADVPALREHARKSAEIAANSNIAPEDTAAYVRAGFTSDEQGVIRPATQDEFVGNLSKQGLLKAMRGQQTSVDSDVPTEANLNDGKPEFKGSEGFRGVVPIAKDLLDQREAVGDLFKSAASWELDNVKKGGAWLLFGDKGLTRLNKKDEVKVTPSAKVSTPEGVADLEKTKQTIEENSGATPRLTKETNDVAKLQDPEEKMRAIREKFEAKRKRAAVVGELYLTGNIDEAQMRNYMETGDMRFSKYDIEKHDASVYAEKANANARVLKAEKQLYDAKVEAAKATSKSFDDNQKQQAEVTKKLTNVGTAVARYVGNRKGYDAQQIKALEGEIETLAVRFMGNKRYSTEAMGETEFAAMWSSAVEMYINDKGASDLSVTSITPYVTTVEGKYKPRSAEVIKQIASANKEMSLEDVRTAHNEMFQKAKADVEEMGGVWTDETQEGFYELFKEEYGLR